MLQEALILIASKLMEACEKGLCIRYCLIGGLAVSARGYLRATEDIDFLIEVDDSQCNILAQFLGGTFTPADMGDPLNGVVRIQFDSGATVQAIRLGKKLSDAAFSDYSNVAIADSSIPVIGVVGLCLLKCYAGSELDLNDARNVLLVHQLNPKEHDLLESYAKTFGVTSAFLAIVGNKR